MNNPSYYKPDKRRYYALVEFDLSYSQDEVECFIECWNEGVPVLDIWKEIKKEYNSRRLVDEIVLLAFDLSFTGKIKERNGGVFGNG